MVVLDYGEQLNGDEPTWLRGFRGEQASPSHQSHISRLVLKTITRVGDFGAAPGVLSFLVSIGPASSFHKAKREWLTTPPRK